VNKGVVELTMDDMTLSPDSELKLVDDGATHQIRVTLG
jgi:hypothetical protein